MRKHAEIVKERCAELNIPVNHFAIPRKVWNTMQEKKTGRGKWSKTQTTLDGVAKKLEGPQAFSTRNTLHAVVQHIVCTDQSLATADKISFRNCLVAMRPRTVPSELPSSHDVTTHLHNEFVSHIKLVKAEIEVR
jgi:hypothetical protein